MFYLLSQYSLVFRKSVNVVTEVNTIRWKLSFAANKKWNEMRFCFVGDFSS